jgi:hypothetical protein
MGIFNPGVDLLSYMIAMKVDVLAHMLMIMLKTRNQAALIQEAARMAANVNFPCTRRGKFSSERCKKSFEKNMG